MGSKGNRKVIKIDDIKLSGDLNKRVDDAKFKDESSDINTFFKNKKVKIVLEE